MRTYFLALGWGASILLVALVARFGGVERESAQLLLMTLPTIAFITLLGGRDCRLTERRS